MARRGLLHESTNSASAEVSLLGSKTKEANGPPIMTPTPCVKICVIHTVENICVGCYRTREEISKWKFFSDAQKKKVLDDLENRKKMIYRRRGGKRKDSTLNTKDQNGQG